MSNIRSLKQGLAQAHKLWSESRHDQALGKVEELLSVWPGNPQLLVMFACLVQLQESPTHTLEEAKEALQRATEIDEGSPAAAIELGHFLDAVEDDPQAASKVFQEAATNARRFLISALLGQARTLLQLSKSDEAIACLMEAVFLSSADPQAKRSKWPDRKASLFRGPESWVLPRPLVGPFASEIETLLNEAMATPAETAAK